MRTVNDLHETFLELEHDAPTAADVLASLHVVDRSRSRGAHQRGWMILAAAAVLAIGIAVPVLVTGTQHHRSTPAASDQHRKSAAPASPILVPVRVRAVAGERVPSGSHHLSLTTGVCILAPAEPWCVTWGLPGRDGVPPESGSSSSLIVNGHRWTLYPDQNVPDEHPHVRLDGSDLRIFPRFDISAPYADVKAILSRLDLAPDLDDPSTWFDAQTALPH